MSNCYLCDKPFDGRDVVDHGEHIIQNGIGGLLIVRGILCEACGGDLGGSVDDGLGKALRALCIVFDIRRDRDKRLVVPAEVTLKDGLRLDPPTRDFFVEFGTDPRANGPAVIQENTAGVAYILGSTDKQARAFAKSEKIARLQASGSRLHIGADITQLIDRINLRVDCNSLDLDRGLIKIAIGYARQNNIDRRFLQHLILDRRDIIRDEALVQQTVLPYYPTGWGESLYEAERYVAEDFPPNHQLSLFSHGERLFCYIDLFGVIQRYVLLSNAWTGQKIRARYVQRCPKWVYAETDGRSRRIQDIHMMAQEYGIEMDGRSWDEVARAVRHAATHRAYSLPPADHLVKPIRMLEFLVRTGVSPHIRHEVFETVRRRAAIAEREFGCRIDTSTVEARLPVEQFLRDWDPEDFRITNEKGFSPDLSAGIDASRLSAYRDFRLRQFSRTYAQPWSIEAS
jgi:hypothetical protein